MKRRLLIALAAILGLLAVALWIRAIRYASPFQERQFADAPLSLLEKDFPQYQGNAIFLYHLGRKLNRAERYEEAASVLESAAGLNRDDARIRSEWADALAATGKISAAFGQLTQFARTHPDDAQAHLMLGQFYGAQNSMERAAQELEKCVALDPQSARGWKLLTVASSGLRQPARAGEAARRAVALAPGDAEAQHLLGVFTAINEREAALAPLREAVRLAPENTEFARDLGKTLLESPEAAERAEGETVLRAAVASQPDDPDANRLLGKALLAHGDSAAALPPLERSWEKQPWVALTAKLLADAHRAQGQAEAASSFQRKYADLQAIEAERRRLDTILLSKPGDPETHRRMARLLAGRGDADGVVRHHARAERCALDSPKALAPAANDLTDAGFADAALALARLARQHSRTNPAVYEALGNALLAKNRVREAAVQYALATGWGWQKIPLYDKKLREAVARRAANPSPADRIVQAALREKRSDFGPRRTSDAVMAQLKRAAEMEPDNVDALWHLFRFQLGRREHDAALQTGRRLIALSPESTEAQIRVAILLLNGDKAGDGSPQGAGDADEIKRCIAAARPDKTLIPSQRYADGLFARRERRWPDAVRELREAVRLDPSADFAFLQLAQAERAAGNDREANAAAAEYRRRQTELQRESDLLDKIAKNPQEIEPYRETILYYRQRGRLQEAAAIKSAAARRPIASPGPIHRE